MDGEGGYFSSQSNLKHKGLEDTLSGSDFGILSGKCNILFRMSQCNICSGGHNATFVLVGTMQHLF